LRERSLPLTESQMVRLSGCIVKQTLFEARKCHLAVCGSTGCSGPFPYRMKKSRFEIRTLLLMRVGIIQVHAMIRYIPVAALAPTCEATLGCMWRPQNLSLNILGTFQVANLDGSMCFSPRLLHQDFSTRRHVPRCPPPTPSCICSRAATDKQAQACTK